MLTNSGLIVVGLSVPKRLEYYYRTRAWEFYTIGQLKVSNLGTSTPLPIAAILDLPRETFTSLTNAYIDGLEQCTTVLKNWILNIRPGGDEEAMKQAIAASNKVEEILPTENYDKSMSEAITSRFVDRIQFLWTIFN